MSNAKSYRVDEENSQAVKELWRKGIKIDEDLKESEIVNFLLKKHLATTDINEVVKGRKKRWEREPKK